MPAAQNQCRLRVFACTAEREASFYACVDRRRATWSGDAGRSMPWLGEETLNSRLSDAARRLPLTTDVHCLRLCILLNYFLVTFIRVSS